MSGLGAVHVRQPTPSSCAQACAAMLTGRAIETVLRELPHTKKGGTKHRALIDYLIACGVPVGKRFESALRGLPPVAIVRITWDSAPVRAHLVLKSNRTWYDPLAPRAFVGDLPSNRFWGPNGRVTSFCPVLYTR